MSLPIDSKEIDSPSNTNFVVQEFSKRCVGNAVLMTKVMGAFLKTFRADYEQLRTLHSALDFDSLRKMAHRMRGASGNVAAPRLHHLTAEIESAAASGNIGQVAACLLQLTDAWSDFETEMLSWTPG